MFFLKLITLFSSLSLLSSNPNSSEQLIHYESENSFANTAKFEEKNNVELFFDNTCKCDEIIEIKGKSNFSFILNISSSEIKVLEIDYTEDNNCFIIKIKFLKFTPEATFSFFNQKNKLVQDIPVYFYQTDSGIYISSISQRTNICNSMADQLSKEKISQKEYDEFNAKVNKDYIYQDPTVSKEKQIVGNVINPNRSNTVYGSFKWTDNLGTVFPLRFHKIQLLKSNEGSTIVLKDSLTDENGKFSFTLPSTTSDSFKCFVRVYSEGEYTGVVKKLDTEQFYYYDTEPVNITKSMTGLGLVFTREYTFQNNGIADNFIGKAMEISEALIYGEKYYYEMEGEHPAFQQAEFPRTDGKPGESASTRQPIGNRLNAGTYLGLYTYSYWDVILHEYGHYIQHCVDITDSPGGEHYSHKKEGAKLAWGESWPTIFGNLVTKYYGDELNGIMYINDDYYDAPNSNDKRWGYNLEHDELGLKYGGYCERDIMFVLFDLFDDNEDEDFDKIAVGHYGLWQLVINSGAYTMSDFTSFVQNQTYVEVDWTAFKSICKEYGVSL